MMSWVSGQVSAMAMSLSRVRFLMAIPVISARHSGHSRISGLTNERLLLRDVVTNEKRALPGPTLRAEHVTLWTLEHQERGPGHGETHRALVQLREAQAGGGGSGGPLPSCLLPVLPLQVYPQTTHLHL